MAHKSITGKGYGIFLTVISLLLIFITSFLFQGCSQKSDLDRKISELNQTVELLGQERDYLKTELEELQSEIGERDSLLQSLKDQNDELRETLQMEQEEKNRIEASLRKVQEANELFIYKDLVRVRDIDASILEELKYATDDNFTDTRVYPADARALLRLETALKLKRANQRFERDGYRIKIWDAYRPKSAQEIFWSLVPDPKYVADPAKGSIHNRGASVDVTLVDLNGNELLMPTEYDDFSEKASRNYTGGESTARENMMYLTRVMEESGFTGLPSEWWHFDDKSRSYPLLDADFEIFN